jgi:hypothetical protein
MSAPRGRDRRSGFWGDNWATAAPARGALHHPTTHQACQPMAQCIEQRVVWRLAGTTYAPVIVPADSAAGWETGKDGLHA